LTVVCFSGVLDGVGENINLDLVLLAVPWLVFFTLLKILGVFLRFPVLRTGTEMVSIFKLQHSSISSFRLLRLFKLF